MTAALILALLACGDKDPVGQDIIDNDGGATDTGDTGTVVDDDCPEIDHDQIETSQPVGEPVDVTATVTDDSGVFLVELYFKQETSTNWQRLNMTAQPGASVYTVQIPGSTVGSGGMDYYLRAVDLEQNECDLPTDGEDDPYHFRVDGG